MLIEEYDARKIILDCLNDILTSDNTSKDRYFKHTVIIPPGMQNI